LGNLGSGEHNLFHPVGEKKKKRRIWEGTLGENREEKMENGEGGNIYFNMRKKANNNQFNSFIVYCRAPNCSQWADEIFSGCVLVMKKMGKKLKKEKSKARKKGREKKALMQ
jgi:hypothetical protein